ncbi:stage V sporulation protein B [Clostridium sp. CAG:594]|nr:stage V sporulation protein B [Clostridium sp. CAG:594]
MIKFKNNLLIKNIIILLVSGALAKVLGMLGKIIYTRIAGVNVVGLYTMITPTFMLIISICQFSFPISISKISAEEKYDNKSLLKSAYFVGSIISIILIIILILTSNLIALSLHNKLLAPAILSISAIIPFVMISSVQRGFLHGKEDMLPASITNVTEEIIKIILILFLLPIAINKGDITSVIFLILFNVITEGSNILFMQKAISKKYISNKKGKVNKKIIKEILSISIPTTSVRLIASIGFFLEPIILTNTLLSSGYSPNYITMEYGIINSYIVPLLSIPSFFSISIASALLPNITKAYANKKYDEFNRKLLKLMFLSMLVGAVCLTIILIFPNEILKLVYNVNFGINYIYLIGPFFLILYMQPTLSVALQAMDKTNKLFLTSTISVIIKYSALYVLGKIGFGMNALIFAMIAGIVTTTSLVLIIVLKELKKKTS